MTQQQFIQTVSDEEREQDEAYDPSDPKSPGWYERQCDRADYERKARREDELLKGTK